MYKLFGILRVNNLLTPSYVQLLVTFRLKLLICFASFVFTPHSLHICSRNMQLFYFIVKIFALGVSTSALPPLTHYGTLYLALRCSNVSNGIFKMMCSFISVIFLYSGCYRWRQRSPFVEAIFPVFASANYCGWQSWSWKNEWAKRRNWTFGNLGWAPWCTSVNFC